MCLCFNGASNVLSLVKLTDIYAVFDVVIFVQLVSGMLCAAYRRC